MIQKIWRFVSKFRTRIAFFSLGIASLAWFLFRVIPKPSRATYPCMKAAAPVASSFVAYLLGLTAFSLFLSKAKKHFLRSKYTMALGFIAIGLVGGVIAILNTSFKANAAITLADPQTGNQPIGTGIGIFPGRVVWIHDPAATDATCTNKTGDYWWMDTNTDLNVVSNMLSSGLQKLTGQEADSSAWNALFNNFNNTHGRGDVGYQAGEKIAIKINLNGINNGNQNANVNTSPQICYAILDQLVNVVGVAQTDISIGDPNCPMNSATYNELKTDFPNVIYWGNSSGMTPATATSAAVMHAGDGSFDDKIPQAYVDATYLINLPVFKKHHRAGISISTKNHFGSLGAYTNGAWHLHPSLPCANVEGVNDNGEYGAYRCFVDIMGHKDLGGKTILYLVDGIWGSTNWGHPPIKWAMTPFNNDWPNSLFLSQDQVALESVCFDFLFEEFDEDHPTEGLDVMDGNKGPYPHFEGTDDYLHQAADTTQWPSGISYDPENDGTNLTSLGVHEHWNDAVNKQYTRNLGTGTGIELVSSFVVSSVKDFNLIPEGNTIYPAFPNPFSETAFIRYKLSSASEVQMNIYNNMGQLVKSEKLGQKTSGEYEYTWDGTNSEGKVVPAGTYICSVEVNNSKDRFKMTNKIIFIR